MQNKSSLEQDQMVIVHLRTDIPDRVNGGRGAAGEFTPWVGLRAPLTSADSGSSCTTQPLSSTPGLRGLGGGGVFGLSLGEDILDAFELTAGGDEVDGQSGVADKQR